MDENIRFIQWIDYLKDCGKLTDYTELASKLETNKASISDIKASRKRISIEILKRLKKSYPETNLVWIITGEGDMIISQPVDNNSDYYKTKIEILEEMLSSKNQEIRDLAEKIGRLKERFENISQQNYELSGILKNPV